jgi:predicted nucleic acid-binding protein
MLVIDTSAIVALIDAGDRRHVEAVNALRLRGRPVVSALSLAETGSVVVERVGRSTFLGFLSGFEDGSTLLDCGDLDLPRIRELMDRYRDPALGFADAAVAACAERNGGAVLSFDRRELESVAGDGLIELVP